MVFFLSPKKEIQPFAILSSYQNRIQNKRKDNKIWREKYCRQLCKMDIVFNPTCQLKIWKDKQMK